FLTGFGSSYYHWDPSDGPLFCDRLPMTLGFVAILSGVITERIDATAGRVLLWPLLVLGVVSLLPWRRADGPRLYARGQSVPVLALLVLFLLFAPKYTGTFYWIIAAALYALAKVFEHYDDAIYSAGHILSGHTLKHLAAGAACYAILKYFDARRPVAAPA